MSFDQQYNQEITNDPNQENVREIQTTPTSQIFENPTLLNEMLQNKELLTCYKCKEVFDPQEHNSEHSLDSNNILLGIILNKVTPSSICLKCLSLKMMEVITEQFTKNSKDYAGLFNCYIKDNYK